MGAKQDVRTPETWPSFHRWAVGLVKETPRCQEEPGQGQADPLEGLFACTETPGVNSENAETEYSGVWQWGGGEGRAGNIPFLPASQAG